MVSVVIARGSLDGVMEVDPETIRFPLPVQHLARAGTDIVVCLRGPPEKGEPTL
jgi:hypothetical protein